MKRRFEGGKILAGILTACMLFTGCGNNTSEVNQTTDNNENVEEQTDNTVQDDIEDMGYDLPVSIPNIIVDQKGYRTGSDKLVIFRGEELPETFTVMNADTNEAVYTGMIRDTVYNEELGEYDSYGYFTDLQENGTYYIYADILGSSYDFEISESMYDDIFAKACLKYYSNRCGMAVSEELAGADAHVACHIQNATLQEDPSVQLDVSGGWHMDENANRYVIEGSQIAETLIMGYEMYSEKYGDDIGIPESGNDIPDVLDEVKYEIDWLLKMQDESTGGVYGAAITDTNAETELTDSPVYVTPVDMDATIEFSTVMAKFSYIYNEYDSEYATKCLRAADRAWSCYCNNVDTSTSTSAFKAAAELYRATGSSKYEAILTEYFGREDFSDLFNTDDNVFNGGVTYISTNQKVNVDMCSAIMKLLMKKSENIGNTANNATYFVTDTSENAIETILNDMKILTITDHIIYNHEYTTIIENHVHYLMGRNQNVINYITEDTERTYADDENYTGLLNDPVMNAEFIFMLAVIKE